MRKFILKIIYFILPIALLIGGAWPVEWCFYRKSLSHPEATVGFIGDSHAQYGVTPETFPEMANFGRRATPPLIWGVEMETILSVNPQIKTFMVELCPLQLAQNLERTPHERAYVSRCYFPENFMLEIVYAHRWNGNISDSFFRDYMRGVVIPFLKRLTSFSSSSVLNEGFKGLDVKLENTQWWKTGKRTAFTKGVPPSNLDTQVMNEVKSILDVIKKRGVRVVLVTLPLWKWYRDRTVTPEQMKFFNQEMKHLQDRYECEWLDFRDELQDLQYWGDNSHLNREGALKFSRILRDGLMSIGAL